MKIHLPPSEKWSYARIFAVVWVIYTAAFGAAFLALAAMTSRGGDGPADSPAIEMVGAILNALLLPMTLVGKALVLLGFTGKMPTIAFIVLWAVNAGLVAAVAAGAWCFARKRR